MKRLTEMTPAEVSPVFRATIRRVTPMVMAQTLEKLDRERNRLEPDTGAISYLLERFEGLKSPSKFID